MGARRHLLPTLFLAAACLVPGCRREPPPLAATRYPIEGRVVEVDRASRSVTLAHGDIPGFMPAMTMPFVVLRETPPFFRRWRRARRCGATLVVSDSRYWLEELVVVGAPVPLPGASPAAALREPQPGDALPDVALVDQDGRALHLRRVPWPRARSQLRLHALPDARLLPVPDGRLRARAPGARGPAQARPGNRAPDRELRRGARPAGGAGRAYGLPFQKTKPPFSHWRLATGRLDEIRRLGAALGLDFSEEDGSFTHNLRTAVIGTDGRLRRLFRGNDWKPEELGPS